MNIEWEELKEAAERVFSIVNYKPQIDWPETAWNLMIQAGKASYDDEAERHTVIMRFLVLGTIYQCFCDKMWDSPPDICLEYWIEPIDHSPIIFSQMYAKRNDKIEYEFEDILAKLIEDERDLVVTTLDKEFEKQIELGEGLFRSLFKSTRFLESVFTDEEEYEDPDDPFERVPGFNPLAMSVERYLEVGNSAVYQALEWYQGGCFRTDDR